MTPSIIDLLRHGEPEGGRLYRGHSFDDPLSTKGWQQMQNAIGDSCPWQTIITSPMQRCLAFATDVAEKNNLPLCIVDSFKEVGFGEWEGRTPDEIKSTNMLQYTAFYQDPVNSRPRGAEPLDDFITRVTTAYELLLSENGGKQILIVAHAGVIRAIIAHVLNAPANSMYHLKINPAGISRIHVNDFTAQIELLNSKL